MGNIINLFRAYNYNEMPKDEFISEIWTYNALYPLPSGKWGNILALAIELNYYVVAKSILENACLFDCDFENDNIAFDYDGNNGVMLEDVLIFSSLTKNTPENIRTINDFSGVKRYKRNELCYLELRDKYVSKGEELVFKCE